MPAAALTAVAAYSTLPTLDGSLSQLSYVVPLALSVPSLPLVDLAGHFNSSFGLANVSLAWLSTGFDSIASLTYNTTTQQVVLAALGTGNITGGMFSGTGAMFTMNVTDNATQCIVPTAALYGLGCTTTYIARIISDAIVGCPAAINASLPTAASGVTWTAPVAASTPLVSSAAPGSPFPIGTTTVKYVPKSAAASQSAASLLQCTFQARSLDSLTVLTSRRSLCLRPPSSP